MNTITTTFSITSIGSFDCDLFYKALPQFAKHPQAKEPLFVQSSTIQSLKAVMCEVRPALHYT